MYQWILAVIVGLLSLLIYHLIFRLELFKSIKVEKISLPKSILIYTPYQGNYHNLMPIINGMKDDFKAYFESKGMSEQFKSLRFFGIYYDNPKALVDANKGRAVVGLILGRKEDPKIDPEEFLQFSHKSLSYKVLDQAKSTAFGASFPLHGMLNLFSAIMRGYPKIMQWGIQHGLMEKSKCSMEIYDWHGKQLHICFPYGKVAESMLGLSGFEQAEYK